MGTVVVIVVMIILSRRPTMKCELCGEEIEKEVYGDARCAIIVKFVNKEGQKKSIYRVSCAHCLEIHDKYITNDLRKAEDICPPKK